MARESRRCALCGASALEQILAFSALPRVTSDCVPFPDGGKLAVCRECSGAQALADEDWFADIGRIYRTYDLYHQSGGREQVVLDPRSGALRSRSEVLLERLAEMPDVPKSGRALDVGCGTGGTLRAFADRRGWRLHGLDIDERNLPSLCAIPRFEALFTCPPQDVEGPFDMVTMVHSLEHFAEPVGMLNSLGRTIAPGGRLFIQVPNAADNPFEYLVADHLIHFTVETLRLIVQRAGLTIDCLASDWVAKELSLVARPNGDGTPLERSATAPQTIARVREQIRWLHRVIVDARDAAHESGAFGLFGTSIAGTWLCGALGDRVAFFVEEDRHRIGRTLMGRPILSPSEVPSDGVVFIPLIPAIAVSVRDRLGHAMNLRLPPTIE